MENQVGQSWFREIGKLLPEGRSLDILDVSVQKQVVGELLLVRKTFGTAIVLVGLPCRTTSLSPADGRWTARR